MSPPPRNYQDQNQQPQQQQLTPLQQQNPTQQQPVVPFVPATSVPSTPIPLYPTGAAAIIPAPPTYELIPNRIFVGGFPTTTTECDLREHFEKFYAVKDVKMVKSLDGQSKGYGFITFETEEQAESIRQLSPKKLEFRNRKLNLGPAIRKINATAFPPGYAIATSSPLVPASPSFGYAVTATPSPYGFSLTPAPQMFVYPPVGNQDQNGSPGDQQSSTPQSSPTSQQQQPQQIFFGAGDQEQVRTYASAVTGVQKPEPSPESHSSSQPQPLGNSNMMNAQYPQPQQWHSGNEQHVNMNNNHPNGMMYYNENHSNGNWQMPPQQFMQDGDHDKNRYPVPVYMNGNGMYQNYAYMPPPIMQGQYPPLMRTPYWHPQQQKNPYVGYNCYNNNNNWMGPVGDMHHNQAPQHQPYYYGYQQPPQGIPDENAYPRPLQPPRAGKKNRKPSESQDKKNKSPSKGVRADKNSSPDSKAQKKWTASNVSPLSSSLQSLAVSSPTKN